MSMRLGITARQGLEPQDQPGQWLSTGPEPRLALTPPALPLPPGWYRLRLRMQRISCDSDTRLILHPADGAAPQEMRLPMGLNGQLDHVFRLPFAVAALELQPFRGQGAVQVDRVRLSSLGLVLRTLLMLGRVALYFQQGDGLGLLRQLTRLPLSPDVTIAPDASRLETLYRLIKRRMVLRSLPASDYGVWIAFNECLQQQPTKSHKPGAAPRFSILLPLSGDATAVQRSLDSLVRQTLESFECLLLGTAGQAAQAEALCRALPAARFVEAKDASGTGLLSAGLAGAKGAMVLCLLPGDQLAGPALTCFAIILERNPSLTVLYGDEDRIGPGGQRKAPMFKPDWDPELLPGFNYLGPSFACARPLALGIALPEKLSLQAALFHLALWATQQAGAKGIGHIARVLLHRSTSDPLPSLDAEKLAVARSFCAVHRPGFRISPAQSPGLRLLEPPEPEAWPRVSVIIPTRDGLAVLRPCLEGLLTGTDYPDLEVLVADNGSTDPDTLAYLHELQASGAARVLRLDMPFNYSRLNNICAREAGGEILVFMNNDVEVVRADWLKAMAAQALRPEVGAVGALLLYPNGLVQHAGVVLGLGGLAGHPRKGGSMGERGSFMPLACTRSVLAVTGACLAVRRGLFHEVGGFEERLAVAFNDVDLCLRIARTGRRNIWTPKASLLHHESYTRGSDQNRGQSRRFRKEKLFLKQRWGRTLFRDRYYNPNLTLDVENCQMALLVTPDMRTKPRNG